MRLDRIIPVLLVLILTIPIWGCGSGSTLPGKTGRVFGKATYKNQAIPAGSVVVMVHNQTGIVATGVTNSSGEFTVTMRGRPEVLVGDYRVNIKPVGEVPDNVNKLTPETVPDTWKAIPQKYWSGGESPETFVVKEGNNRYELTLSD